MTKREILIEKLAELEHLQWIKWTSTLIREEKELSKKRIKRWKEFSCAYVDLPNSAKDMDREWAKKAIKIFDEYCQ